MGVRASAAVCALALAVSVSGLDAQSAGRTLGVTVTHSVGGGISAHPPPCWSGCVQGDVLSPLSLTTVELELALPFRTRERWGLEYHVRVVPLAMMRNNPTDPAMMGSRGWFLPQSTGRGSTLGIGVKPAGVRGWLGGDELRVEADASVGILRFGTALLAANAAKLNFVYEFGVGLRMPWLARGGVVVGYRRHHLSNAGLAEVNPGLNSHMLLVGVPIL